MSYVPETANPSDGFPEPAAEERLTITVHPQATTKRPVGFAPWPKEPKQPKRKKRK